MLLLKNKPNVSIIILTYNQEDTVQRTIKSILQQRTDYSYEIIIGEDASIDSTRKVCNDFYQLYPNIIHILPPSINKGVLKNFMDCLEIAQGEYIMCCAGDDWWHNEKKIQIQVDVLKNNPQYALVYSGYIIYNKQTGIYSKKKPHIVNHKNLFMSLLQANFIIAPTVCYRTDILKAINFTKFITQGFIMEDYPILLELSINYKFHCVKDQLVTYSIGNDSLSNKKNIKEKEQFEICVQNIRQFFISEYKKYHLQQYVQDCFYRTLAHNGIKYGIQDYSINNFRMIKYKSWKDWTRILLCKYPLLFKLIRNIS